MVSTGIGAEQSSNDSMETPKASNSPAVKRTTKEYSPHLNPVHVNTTHSLLSRRITPGFGLSSADARNRQREGRKSNIRRPLDITGFKHLLMLLLVTGNVKMLWTDWAQFGLQNTLENFGLGMTDLEVAAIIAVVNMLFMPLALFIELVASWAALSSVSSQRKDQPNPRLYLWVQNTMEILHIFTCILSLYVGSYLTWEYVQHPLVATGCETNVIVTFLKLVSFTLTNRELRMARVNKTPIPGFYTSSPPYPNNLTLRNLLYFWVAPTLVYQPVYPKLPTVRYSVIPPLIGEIITGILVSWVLMMQMGMSVIEHLVENFNSWQKFIEDYLTLATINIIIWLVGFVILFQSLLNLIAELTRFADRNFYGDWWNAGSVGTFWRDWNLPVSNYFRRHLYAPLRSKGVSRMVASNAVFLVSALLHELMFGVATHNFNGVAFLCMFVQPILILATEPLEKMRGRGTTVGNCVFWISILFGQPTAIVIYYLEWVARNPDSTFITSWWKKVFREYIS